MSNPATTSPAAPRPRRRYVPAVGPRLRKLLLFVLGLFAVLAVNSVYLGIVTLAEWWSGQTYQNYFYQLMFLGHLVLGLLIILPLLVYGAIHIKNSHNRPNRRAVMVGYALFAVAIVLLISGLTLTRGLPLLELRDPAARSVAYWAHVITPFAIAWLFILHRLAGPRIRWRVGGMIGAVAGAFAIVMLIVQAQDPRQWNVEGPASGEQYFFPSLARTATGDFIPAQTMMMDDYCAECHADAHAQWSQSVHRFASFNNPAYLFSVRKTREFSMERDGTVQAARFCAGCHDLVPFFSGAFDDPDFDDVNHPTAQAGITCTGCHAITHVNSPRGNADYTIEEPLHYPFAFSDQPLLAWTNRLLVKAKPEFHKRSFLKPLHQSAEFCSTCHKVHLAQEFNGYKWLRGQNHYDSYLLSGVSGHGINAFYYPPKAQDNCNGCHMELLPSEDFGAQHFDDSGVRKLHNHHFPSANTAIPHLLDMPEWVNAEHRRFLEGSVRVDLFGLKRGGSIEGELIAPLRPDVPVLEAGQRYLLETVVRTLRLGHPFTQGTADSNEVWLDATIRSGGRVIGRSGGIDARDGSVDPWSHFINVYMLDRDGNRIDRRNPEHIFVPLYNNQIPPGGADTVHFAFEIPADAEGPIEIEVKLQYRKFDTTFMRHFQAEAFRYNDLPITTVASDVIQLPLRAGQQVANTTPDIPLWQRWNDYGIGLFRKAGAGELRQAEVAFKAVETLGQADGALNVARVYLREGRLDEARDALGRAAASTPPAHPWSVTFFSAQVDLQNGFLDEAIAGFERVIATEWQDARDRGFDFSQDYTLLAQLAQTQIERAKLERGEQNAPARNAWLDQAIDRLRQALRLDSEFDRAHFLLAQALALKGDAEAAAEHQALHAKYKVDDNARDRAIAAARRASPAADHAADAVVVYDLQREGAFELAPAAVQTDLAGGER